MAFKDNIYDGHTLPPQLRQVKRMLGRYPDFAIADRGYKERKKFYHTEIITPGPLPAGSSLYQKRKKSQRCRSRAAIEPIIGHLKKDHGMLRNYLKGNLGDSLNTIIAAAAFNFRKMLNRIKEEVRSSWLYFLHVFLELIFIETGSKNGAVHKS